MPTGRRRWRRTSGARPHALSRRRKRPTSVDAGGRQGRDFAPERTGGNLNVFQAAADHLKALQAGGKRVLVASWTEGSAERMGGVLSDHGVSRHPQGGGLARSAEAGQVAPSALPCLGIERGFEAPDFAILSRTGCAGRPHGAGASPRSAGRRISSPRPRRWRRAIWSPISSMAWAAISG